MAITKTTACQVFVKRDVFVTIRCQKINGSSQPLPRTRRKKMKKKNNNEYSDIPFFSFMICSQRTQFLTAVVVIVDVAVNYVVNIIIIV